MSAVERLRRAADVAGTRPTHKKAIDAAWAAIHQPHLDDDGAEMGDAFRAWCATEDFDKWPGYLSGILRATYSTPAEVAASLHRAADAQEEAEAEGRGFDIRQANAEARARQQAEHDEALDLLRRDPDAAARQLVRLQAHLDVEREQRRALEAREREAIFEAGRYRLLWNSAAACLQHNRKRLAKPRGADERRMLAHADTAHGPVSAGTTDGWLDWLDDPSEGKTPVRRVQHLRLFEGAILGGEGNDGG